MTPRGLSAAATLFILRRTRIRKPASSATALSPTSLLLNPYHWQLLLAVFVDLFGVSLIVPLLPKVFKSVGVKPELWGTIASVYSLAQIVGGVFLGGLSDRYGRRASLLLSRSMCGAGLSYGLVGLLASPLLAAPLAGFGIPLLVLSRVIVGLVKQTMTLSTAFAADHTPDADRAAAVAHVVAAVSVGWMAGQAVGVVGRIDYCAAFTRGNGRGHGQSHGLGGCGGRRGWWIIGGRASHRDRDRCE